jgi:hypothetical protein
MICMIKITKSLGIEGRNPQINLQRSRFPNFAAFTNGFCDDSDDGDDNNVHGGDV